MRKRFIMILTIINLMLLVISTVCFVGTSINNKIINSIHEDFTYREEEGKVILRLKDDKDVTIRFSEDSAKIVESYKLNNREAEFEVVLFIKEYISQSGEMIMRDTVELYGELRLHNILFSLGYQKSHTEDCDLDFVADKRWYVNAASKIIGWMGI